MITIDQLREISTIKCCSIIREIDVLSNGNIRIGTIFTYQDGSLIDLFIGKDTNVLTDFGTTLSLFSNYGIRITDKIIEIVEEELLYGEEIKFIKGCLQIEIDSDLKNFIDKLLILVQICIKVSIFIHCTWNRLIKTNGANT